MLARTTDPHWLVSHKLGDLPLRNAVMDQLGGISVQCDKALIVARQKAPGHSTLWRFYVYQYAAYTDEDTIKRMLRTSTKGFLEMLAAALLKLSRNSDEEKRIDEEEDELMCEYHDHNERYPPLDKCKDELGNDEDQDDNGDEGVKGKGDSARNGEREALRFARKATAGRMQDFRVFVKGKLALKLKRVSFNNC